MNCIKCGSPLIEGAVFCLKCDEHQPGNLKEITPTIKKEEIIVERNNDLGTSIIKVDNAIRKFRFMKTILTIVVLAGFFFIKDFVIPTISKINYNLNINKVSQFTYDGYEFSITGKYSHEIKYGALYIKEGNLKKHYLIEIAEENEIKKEVETTEKTLKNRIFFCTDDAIDSSLKYISCYTKFEENKYFAIFYMTDDINDDYEKIENIIPILDSAKKI